MSIKLLSRGCAIVAFLLATLPSPEQLVRAQDSARIPVPTSDARKAARKEIASLIPLQASTREAHGKLGKKLLDTGLDTEGDPPSQFALLNLAREQFEAAGDIKLAFDVINQIEERFVIDPDSVRIDALRNVGKASGVTPTQRDDIKALGMQMVDRLSEQKEYAKAAAVAKTLLSSARALRSTKMIGEMQTLAVQSQRIATAYESVAKSLETLKSSPDDPDSNLVVGRFLTFFRSDWQTGFQHLAKSNDPSLKPIATLELESPGDGNKQLQLADHWLEYAGNANADPLRKPIALGRAASWYKRASENLAGLSKQKAKIRVEQLAADKVVPIDLDAKRSITSVAAVSSDPEASATTGSEQYPIVANGIYDARRTRVSEIDLLQYVSPARDQILGTWTEQGNALRVVASKDHTRIRLPVIPPDEYDLEMEIESRSAEDMISLAFPGGRGVRLGLLFGKDGGSSFSGLEMLRGKGYRKNGTAIPRSFLSVGKRTVLRVAVRHQGIATTFDGKPGPSYRGDMSKFEVFPKWEEPHRLSFAFGCHANSHVVLHSAKLTPVKPSSKTQSLTPMYWQHPTSAGVPFSHANREKVFIDELPVASFRVGSGTLGLRGATGRAVSDKGSLARVTHNGVAIPHALSVRAWENGEATVVFNIDGKFKNFEALVGPLRVSNSQLNRQTKMNGTAYFRIYGDGRLLVQTNGQKIRDDMKPIKVDVTGIKTLTLATACRGAAWGGWCAWLNPTLTK